MTEWIRKRIYKTAQSIADKLRTKDEIDEIDFQRMESTISKFSQAPDLLKGESPWQIGKNKYGAYSVYVYNYINGRWEDITGCSSKIIGVNEYEIRRVMLEKFGAYLLNPDYERYVGFKKETDARIFIDEIERYYDDYHMPRAMMERMMFYMEGGYPPYFENHKLCPSKEDVEEEVAKRQGKIKRDD